MVHHVNPGCQMTMKLTVRIFKGDFCQVLSKWSKIFAAVAVMQTGIARELVHDRSVKYHTRMARDLSQFLLLLPSMDREKE